MYSERPSIFSARAITLALSASLLCVAQTPTSKFVGTWKENASKRKISPATTLKFRRDAQGNLEEIRGSEARPLVQPVRFDGKPYSVDSSKNTIVWKQIDKTHFERTISENGKLLTTRRIQISDDGKMLTEDTERTLVDGAKEVVTWQYRRTTGESQYGSGAGESGGDGESAENVDQPGRGLHRGSGLKACGSDGTRGNLRDDGRFEGSGCPDAGSCAEQGRRVHRQADNRDIRGWQDDDFNSGQSGAECEPGTLGDGVRQAVVQLLSNEAFK